MGLLDREHDPYNRMDAVVTGCVYGLTLSLIPLVVGVVMSAPFIWSVEGLIVPAVFVVCGGIIGFFTARKI